MIYLKHLSAVKLTARGSTVVVIICRQIMTTKVGPRTERVKYL